MRTALLSRAAAVVVALAGVASFIAGCDGASAAPEPVGAPIVSLPVAPSENPATAALGGEIRTFAPRGLGPLDGRPYKARVPSRYDKSKPTPLVVLLHGFGASGELQEVYLNLSAQAEARTVLYAYPDGTQNPVGLRFWNSQEWCCDFFKSGIDDVAYVTAVIDDMSARYNVDKKRIYVIGHSNGGFMAHRMACELSGRVAAIVSLAGAQQNDPTRCLPKEPVSVLQVHGTLDVIIGYGGARGQYPGALESLGIWANRNGCTGRLTYSGENRDLDIGLLGPETKVEKYTGCPATGAVELWSIQGAGHVPVFTAHFAEGVYDFFASHPKP